MQYMKRNYLRIRLNLLLTVLVCFTFLNLAQGANLDGPTINIGEEYLRKKEQVTITGTVTDENGLSLPGVNVVEKGTTLGTITDGNGKFSLKVSGPQAILVFSFIGYATQEVQIGNQTQINISLTPDIESLDEVVIVGYGTQKKATLSGSVASVKGENIAKSPAMNITNSIASTIPGLVAVGQSGEPGSDYSTLYIRGRSSLNDNSPLVVVDGVPNRSLERIDPASIESISVLKDASAAIYGSQAANGVILVTTKRGSTDKLVFTANYTSGWSRPTRVPELTNAAEYAQLVNEIDYYDNRTATYSDSDIEQFANGTDLWRYPNSDWYKLVLKPWSMQSNANLTMSGGNEKIQSFVSVSTRQQDGFYKQSANKYAQHDLRINNDFKVNDYISTSLDASFRLEQRKFPTTSSAAIFRDLMTALPIQVAYWPNGLPGPPLDVTSQNNPTVLVTSDAGTNQSDNYIFNTNAKINIKIPWVKGLSVSATGTFDRGLYYTKNFTSKYDLYAWDKTTVDENNIPILTSTEYGTSDLIQQLDISKSYLINSIATFQRTLFESHNINIIAGVETIENSSNWFSASRKDFSLEFPIELKFGNAELQYANGSNSGANRWLNYFGRVNYAFNDKYIAEYVWRYQGSSKFHQDTRWGFFSGISLAYRISEEGFWKDSPVSSIINNFKIRVSWGSTGNDLIEPYQYYSTYSQYWQYFVTADGVNHPTYYESKTGNPKSQWEEARQANIGADVTFFNSKLTFTADYFNNLRTKILITQDASIPDMTGMVGALPDINLGEMRNHGFDFDVLWADNKADFNYRIGINGCYAKNKVIFFDEAEGVPEWQKKTGHPMESGIYYEAIGIFHNQDELEAYPHMADARTGDVIFKDINGDGQITGDDKKRIDKSTVPTLTGGLSVNAEYRGFDVTFQIQGQAGGVRYLQNLGGKNVQNYLKSFYDNRWTEENPNADYPRTFNRNDEYWVSSENHNTFWLRKTDFIRLKNMELGYNLPETLVTRVGLTSMRIYVGGMNLLTFSSDIKDYDPELEPKGDGFAGQGYPLQKIITTGISIK